MARFCPLFSGSSGNCTYIGASEGGILIDAGVSAKKIKEALIDRGLDLNQIRGIFVTHEHTDHVAGIKTLSKRSNIPIFATKGTMEALIDNGVIESGMDFHIVNGQTDLADMRISNFATSHDCRQSCGYIIETGERKIAVCTDLGYVSDEVRAAISGCDLIMIESNHDLMMLQNGNYPYFLKRRVMGDRGHLSNAACSAELTRLVNTGATRLVLGHISRENNLPDLALETARCGLRACGMEENSDYLLSTAAASGSRMIRL